MKNDPTLFHFTFHRVLDLPEALTAGRERSYLQHFYDELGYEPTAVYTVYFARVLGEPGRRRRGPPARSSRHTSIPACPGAR